MLFRALILLEFVLVVLPLSMTWLLGAWLMVAAPLLRWSPSTSLVGLVLVFLWMTACGAGLVALWALFFRHVRYATSGVPLAVKVCAGLGLIGWLLLNVPQALDAVRLGQSAPVLLAGITVVLLIPVGLLWQFHWLIARQRRF